MKAWQVQGNYPALGGTTSTNNITFVNFGSTSCNGQSDVALMTNPDADDGTHPMIISNIKFIKTENRLYLNRFVQTLSNLLDLHKKMSQSKIVK